MPWFYSSIEKQSSKINSDVYFIELLWKDWNKDKINSFSKYSCLNKDLNIQDINYISNWWLDIDKYINNDCKWITDKVLDFSKSVNNYRLYIKDKSTEKAWVIETISTNSIYADGNPNNWEFDLIYDLKYIDEIIFASKTWNYTWNTFYDIWKDLWNLKDSIEDFYNENINQNNEINNESNIQEDNNINEDIFINEISTTTIEETNSLNYCWIEESNTNLSTSALTYIVSDIYQDISWWNNLSSNIPNNEEDLSNNSDDWNWEISEYLWSYKSTKDNDMFPCNLLYCITIDYITYTQNALEWWNDNITIEYLINRSNWHLKKFASTSLIQGKMTLNNFELGFKNLNLSEIFNMSVILIKKPLPILDIKDKEDNKIIELSSQHFEKYWIDYKKRNDISKYRKIQDDKNIISNNLYLTSKDVINDINDFQDYINTNNRIKSQNDIYYKTVANNKVIENFENQLTELDIFNSYFLDYSKNLEQVIKNMEKIPSDW